MADAPGFPTAERLLALPADDWSQLLVVCLPVLRGLQGGDRNAAVGRLVAVPLGKLVGGRSRAELSQLLTRPGIWQKVEAAIGDGPRPWTVDAADPTTVAALREAAADAGATVLRLRAQTDELERQLVGARRRAAELRDERDAGRRTADGAIARAAAAERRADSAGEALAAARAEVASAHAMLSGADEDRRRAVEREQRRATGGETKLRDELTTARRQLQQLQSSLSDAQRRLAAAPAAPAAAAGPVATPRTGRGERGRPSRLPDGMVRGTTEAAAWLVSEGRVLLLDGYNVTRTNRPAFSFADQRRWLEEAVGTLVQRRQVDATIVWDASLGAGRTASGRRRVTVRYTTADMTADDEIVLHVRSMLDAATPCVVVTDDAELRARLAPSRVDLLDTRSFTWLL
ncbi:MAG: hypothetical protein ACI970_000794 [Myxococcota bacterium]